MIVYKNLFSVFDFLKEKGWNVIKYTPPYFEVMQLYGNRYAYVPLPMSPLYRGQNGFYDPCFSSIHRLSKKKWIEKFENEIRIEEFKSILKDNPEIKELDESKFEVNYLGMAQHYGLDTALMDWTNSAFVAGFFATHDYDHLMDRYLPIVEKVRIGVLYFNPLGSFSNPMEENKLWPIGMEALKRPGEQRAYSMELMDSEDLNTKRGIHKYFFFQDPQVSFSLYNFFRLGTALFPYDPIAEKVRMMKKLRIYSKKSLRRALENSEINPNDYSKTQRILETGGIRFLDESLFYYTDIEKRYIDEEYARKFPDFTE